MVLSLGVGFQRLRKLDSNPNPNMEVQPMKCIRSKKSGRVSRVSNWIATILTGKGVADYVSKSVWKKEVRDAS